MRLNNIKKDYGNFSTILKYNHSFDIIQPRCQVHDNISCMICWPRKKTNNKINLSSLQRTKTTISDYTLSNSFDLFCTFTVNPDKLDSFDIDLCKKKMSWWLNYQRKLFPDLMYIGVSEKHLSGRLHFHFLLKNFKGKLTNSGKIDEKGNIIYNIQNWKWGFSTATEIKSIEKTASYIKKYITKELITENNKKRYFYSNNLKKPTKTINVNFQTEVRDRPLFVKDVYLHENFKVYKIVN